MKSADYEYLAETLTGRRARDLKFESQISGTIEGSINQKAVARQTLLDSKTPEEREIEKRRYSLSTYGRAHMEKYSSPIVSDRPLGELQVPGDQIKSTPAPQLKGHSEGEPSSWQDANGRLKLQVHSAPIRQTLQLY
jgi:hypothetical protein